MAMQLIQHLELSSSTTLFTLNNIPNTYNDLMIVASLKGGLSTSYQYDDGGIRFNNDSTSSYLTTWMRRRDTSVQASSNYSFITLGGLYSMTAQGANNLFSTTTLYIPNYADNKPKVWQNDGVTSTATANGVQHAILAGLWNNTSAINRIDIFSLNNQPVLAYSSMTLYGITHGSDGTTTVT